MKKIKWDKVTWYSKMLAVLLFFIVLLVGIYIGSEAQKTSSSVVYHKMLSNQVIQLSSKILKPEENIYPIQIHPGYDLRYQKFDVSRYICQGNELVADLEKDPYGNDSVNHEAISLHMAYGNIELKKIEPKAKFISYTFDKECSNVYAIVQYNKNLMDIFKFDIGTGDYTQLTNNLYLQHDSIEDAVPYPFFIYTINNEKLLVSFITPTTGFDAYTNFTIHEIFNLTSSTFSSPIAFTRPNPYDAPQQWLLPSALLNFKYNILSNVVAINPEYDSQSNVIFKSLIRKDFDLVTGEFIKTTALDPTLIKADPMTQLFFNCPPAKAEPKEHTFCWQKNYHNIFPGNNLR